MKHVPLAIAMCGIAAIDCGVSFARKSISMEGAQNIRGVKEAEKSNQTATITLRDGAWDRVNVEVRTGPWQNACDKNSPYTTTVLYQSGVLIIKSDFPVVCWRRDKLPDTPSSPPDWNQWTEKSVSAGSTYNFDLD